MPDKIIYPIEVGNDDIHIDLYIYNYLLNGFMKKECVIEFSEELYNLSSNIWEANCVLVFDLENKGKRTRIWYDYHDNPKLALELLNQEGIYFKVFLLRKYDGMQRVLPIGVTPRIACLDNLDALRRIKNKKEYDYDVVAHFKPSDYTGRLLDFGLRAASVRIALSKKSWRVSAGIYGIVSLEIKRQLTDVIRRKLGRVEHLERQSRSKICFGFPGAGGTTGLSSRAVEILAIGSCLLTVETNCLELGDFNNCYIKVKNDLSDLEEKVDYYLKHDEEREEIAHNGLEYFNKWLSPEATINYIIDSVRSRL